MNDVTLRERIVHEIWASPSITGVSLIREDAERIADAIFALPEITRVRAQAGQATKSPQAAAVEWLSGFVDSNGTRYLLDDTMVGSLTELLRDEIAQARAGGMEAAARIAENIRGGYTANIRISTNEPELVHDADGPWVLNSDVAQAIRAQALAGPMGLPSREQIKDIIAGRM